MATPSVVVEYHRIVSFNDSIFSLRQEGWLIESRHVLGGTWELRLIGRTTPPEGHKPMTRPQKVVAREYAKAIAAVAGTDTLASVREALPEWMRRA
jgi:hypothetical protein